MLLISLLAISILKMDKKQTEINELYFCELFYYQTIFQDAWQDIPVENVGLRTTHFLFLYSTVEWRDEDSRMSQITIEPSSCMITLN